MSVANTPTPTQHSPKRSSPLSSSCTCDTSAHPSTPHRAPSPTASHPLTPPDSLSRPSPPPASTPQSPLPALRLSPVKDSPVATVKSTLNAAAPLFQSRLDAAIDISELAPAAPPATVNISAPVDFAPTVAPGTQPIPIDLSQLAPAVPARPAISDVTAHAVVAAPTPPHSVPVAGMPISSAQALQAAQAQEEDVRTPNVYINGLPPNFPEDQLFSMTREFGTVLSVRTFTRHVSDKPSGYGFVLYDTVDAAAKCIEALRKYRNLHPSFSKQIHKIPGTPYASMATSEQTLSRPADSFKSRMESLGDKTSTNLYMEGLPLSIDEPTLTALVKPYRIMSSRFFQTRLSNPPRIIAFVRLETRAAAEEIVERLHGRMVRGWQDTGCRISVRFADTSEQRELRRVERASRDGDQSPARLTMAQAALLNLKGAQLPSTSPTLAQFPGTAHASPVLGQGHLGLPQTRMGGVNGVLSSGARNQMFNSGLGQALGTPDSYEDLSANSAMARQGLRASHEVLQQEMALLDAQTQLQLAMGTGLNVPGLAARSDSGYTAMERLLLQAHVQRQQAMLSAQRELLAAGQGRGISDMMNSVGFGAVDAGLHGRDASRRLLDILPSVSEDDFHAGAAAQRHHGLSNTASPRDSGLMGTGSAETSPEIDLGGFDQLSISQQQRQRYQTHASQLRSENGGQSAHARSTTLPSHYLGQQASGLGADYGNMSSSILGPNTNSSIMNFNGTTSLGNSKHQVMDTDGYSARNIHNISNVGNFGRNGASGVRAEHGKGGLAPNAVNNMFNSKRNINIRSNTRISTNTKGAQAIPLRHSHDADDEDEGSPTLSPALTYSGRSPATLSPATPFAGFFPHGGEGFEGKGADVAEVQVGAGGMEKRAAGQL